MKTSPSPVVALDLETVPDVALGRCVLGLAAECSDHEVVLALEAARRVATQQSTDFLKPVYHRIVAVGAVVLDGGEAGGEVTTFASCSGDEAALIAGVGVLLHPDQYREGRPVLVTWNGRSFDLPVLRQRAMGACDGRDGRVKCVALPMLYGPPTQRNYDAYEYRYGTWHCDLADVWSSYGACARSTLVEAAALVGLPCPKAVMGGGEVWPRWQVGDRIAIRDYVLADVITTARLWVRWQQAQGRRPVDLMMALDSRIVASAAAAAALV